MREGERDYAIIMKSKEIARKTIANKGATLIISTYDTGLELLDSTILIRRNYSMGKGATTYWETKLSKDTEWPNMMYRSAFEAINSYVKDYKKEKENPT